MTSCLADRQLALGEKSAYVSYTPLVCVALLRCPGIYNTSSLGSQAQTSLELQGLDSGTHCGGILDWQIPCNIRFRPYSEIRG